MIIKKTATAAPTGSEYAPEESPFVEEGAAHVVQPQAASGMDALRKKLDEVESRKSTKKSDRFVATSERQIILFLSDGAAHIYEEHWLKLPEGKRSFQCLGSSGPEPCPICALGDRPSLKVDFQVLSLEEQGDSLVERVQILTAGIKASRTLLALNDDPKRGPLQGNWYSVYKSGEGTATEYHFEYVKPRDLEEDWMIPQDAAEQLAQQYVGKVEYKVWPINLDRMREALKTAKLDD